MELSKHEQDMIAARTEFKYEDHYQYLNFAMDGAKQRSLKSRSIIYVHKHPDGFCVNAHGVLRLHHVEVCKFKRGVEI